MKHELIIAGFGGQGILFAGQLLAYGGMIDGLEVSWLPSYGPEMRGGTANCTVILSSTSIRSPLIDNPTGLIAMNKPSLVRFEEKVKSGGLVVINQSMVDREITRSDVEWVRVPADDIALELGHRQVANLVALGAYVGASGLVQEESLMAALGKLVSGARAHLIPANKEALKRGLELGAQMSEKGAGA